MAARNTGASVVEGQRPSGRAPRGVARTIALVASLAVLPACVEAQGAELALEQAVRGALEGFPTVAVARARTEEARAAAREADATRFPSIQLTGSATRYQEPMVVGPIHGFTPSSLPTFDEEVYQATFALAYPLFDGGGRKARRQAARAGSLAADAELGTMEQSLILQVIRSYLETYGFRQVVEAHDLRLDALHAERDRVALMRTAGRAALLDSLRVEAALSSAEAERVRATSQLEVAERGLARLAGLTFDRVHAARLRPAAMSDSTEVMREALLEAALSTSPSMRQSRAQQSAAIAGLSAARSRRWPELRLGGGYNGWTYRDGSPTWEWNASLQLTWAVFDGGAIAGAIAKARAARDGADGRVRLATTGLDQDADNALAGLDASRARATSLSVAVNRFAEVARIEKLLLDSGTGTQSDYLKAEADLLAARSGLIDARHAFVVTHAELARLAGQLGYDWISRVTEVQP